MTGVLMLHQGLYLQVLEGPRAIVEDTFLRIIADPRHHGLRILSRRRPGFREFGEFAMLECGEGRHRRRVLQQVNDIIPPGQIGRFYQDRFLPLAIAA